VLLRQVELALLLKTRASVVLTQGLELGPLLGELLRETALRRNGARPSGLLVLRAGRRRGGNLTPLKRLVEAVELRKNEFAIAVVLKACVLRLRVCARVGLRPRWFAPALAAAPPPARTAARAVLLPADRCSRSAPGVPCADALAGTEGGHPRWLDLEVVARQPDLWSRAGKGAQEGNTPGVGRTMPRTL
jgi:hypothetical protein